MHVPDSKFSVAAYDVLAQIYDAEWGFFARRVLSVLEERIFPDLAERARILDLCCGTGNLSQLLHERGYVVTGLDASEGMLRRARQKAPNAEFIRADARSFAVKPVFDAVVSTFDSLNHLLTLDDFRQMAQMVHGALRSGGAFLFDLNMGAGFRARWCGSNGMVHEDAAMIMQSHYDADARLGQINIVHFAKSKVDSWYRHDVVVRQRCYDEEEVVAQLRRVGFASVDVFPAPEGLLQVGRSFFHGRTGSA